MTGAAVDSIVVGLTVIGVNVAMIERRRRWPDVPPPRWPDEKRPYDLWLLYNLWRPFEVLSVVACARAVAHFGDSATEPYLRGVFAVAAVGLASYLFVIGPMFRPHSALSSVRPFDPREPIGLRSDPRVERQGQELVDEYDRINAMSSDDRLGLARQPGLPVNTQLALALGDDPKVLDALAGRADLDPATEFYIDDSRIRISSRPRRPRTSKTTHRHDERPEH
jgi:hypothetical protein